MIPDVARTTEANVNVCIELAKEEGLQLLKELEPYIELAYELDEQLRDFWTNPEFLKVWLQKQIERRTIPGNRITLIDILSRGITLAEKQLERLEADDRRGIH